MSTKKVKSFITVTWLQTSYISEYLSYITDHHGPTIIDTQFTPINRRLMDGAQAGRPHGHRGIL